MTGQGTGHRALKLSHLGGRGSALYNNGDIKTGLIF